MEWREDDSPPVPAALKQLIITARRYAEHGNTARALDALHELESAARTGGPHAESMLAETLAAVHGQRWEWSEALTCLERSRDVLVRVNSRFAADLTASRVEWLNGDADASLDRVENILMKGPVGPFEVTVALTLGYRTEAFEPRAAAEMWHGLFEDFEDIPRVYIGAGFGLARMLSKQDDEPRARQTLEIMAKSQRHLRGEVRELLSDEDRPIHDQPAIDPLVRGRRELRREMENKDRNAVATQLHRLQIRAADLGRFAEATKFALEFMELPEADRVSAARADKLGGVEPVEVALWYAVRSKNATLVGVTANRLVDRLLAMKRPERASALVEKLVQHHDFAASALPARLRAQLDASRTRAR